jgi:hypothetical protein
MRTGFGLSAIWEGNHYFQLVVYFVRANARPTVYCCEGEFALLGQDKSGEKPGVGCAGVSTNAPSAWRDGRGVEISKNLFRLAAEGFGSRIGPWDSSEEI